MRIYPPKGCSGEYESLWRSAVDLHTGVFDVLELVRGEPPTASLFKSAIEDLDDVFAAFVRRVESLPVAETGIVDAKYAALWNLAVDFHNAGATAFSKIEGMTYLPSKVIDDLLNTVEEAMHVFEKGFEGGKHFTKTNWLNRELNERFKRAGIPTRVLGYNDLNDEERAYVEERRNEMRKGINELVQILKNKRGGR